MPLSTFPNGPHVFVKTESGGHRPIEEEDLRALCHANALHMLKRGEYFCANCTGIRTEEGCKTCDKLAEGTPFKICKKCNNPYYSAKECAWCSCMELKANTASPPSEKSDTIKDIKDLVSILSRKISAL